MEPTAGYTPGEDIFLFLYSFLASLGRSDLVDVSDEEEEKKLAKSPLSVGMQHLITHHSQTLPQHPYAAMLAIPGYGRRRSFPVLLAINLHSDAYILGSRIQVRVMWAYPQSLLLDPPLFVFPCKNEQASLEKGTAPHSSILAWRIPWIV